jgi:putative endonuclease
MRHPLRRLIRPGYVKIGEMLDRWYEELPWRKRVPTGRRGEQMAARYLRRCGYIILARNYRSAGGEIDLVALDEARLVFVEVKYRTGTGFGPARDAADEGQRERIRRAARAYAEWRGVPEMPARFDLIAISGAGRSSKVELVKDAF